ncbi:MAG: ribbon-helix-helix protein, CopG family [Polyangiaceae bacterium]|nr:ribbon-helix-helix protein, CopG family [Polyangiaceae bacterium]
MYTYGEMNEIVHARLDSETERLLRRLERQLGWTVSEVMRRAIRVLAEVELPQRRRHIVGLGEFESGIEDLGSNKAHLSGFGT